MNEDEERDADALVSSMELAEWLVEHGRAKRRGTRESLRQLPMTLVKAGKLPPPVQTGPYRWDIYEVIEFLRHKPLRPLAPKKAKPAPPKRRLPSPDEPLLKPQGGARD